jgi:hypothetical protein
MFFIKNYIFLTFCIFLQLTIKIDCLNQDDLCKKTLNEKRCQILNNGTLIIKCLTDTNLDDCDLKSEWKIKCGHFYCAKDNVACEIFKLKSDHTAEKAKLAQKSWKDKLAIKSNHRFKVNMKKCSNNENNKNDELLFEWKPSDVCDKQTRFDCNGKRLSHKCIDMYCVKDEKVCTSLKSLLRDFNFDFKKMNEMLRTKKCLPNEQL